MAGPVGQPVADVLANVAVKPAEPCHQTAMGRKSRTSAPNSPAASAEGTTLAGAWPVFATAPCWDGKQQLCADARPLCRRSRPGGRQGALPPEDGAPRSSVAPAAKRSRPPRCCHHRQPGGTGLWQGQGSAPKQPRLSVPLPRQH